VPTAVKWQQEFGDELQVIFVGEPASVVERFALERKWLGTAAMWTDESPVSPQPLANGGFGTPYSVLVSSDGEVLVTGLTSQVHQAVREGIEAEIARARQAPAGTPKELEKAWKLFLSGDVADALEEAGKRGKDPELSEAARAASTEFYLRAMSRVRRGQWLADNGYPLAARAHLERVSKELDGVIGVVEDARMVLEFLDSETMEPELSAAKSLASLEAKLYENGAEAGLAKKLSELAEEAPSPALAARAERLARMATPS
jgi:hypothetical protein